MRLLETSSASVKGRSRSKLLAIVLLASCSSVVTFDDVVETGVQCGDGVDNDGDDQIDCEDLGCAADPACNGCGNGVVDSGEQCDDGNAVPDDGCSPNCRLDVGCGNNVVETGEQCDDGNADNTDGCAGCQDARCGDGFVRAGSAEQCDDGNADDTDGCPTTCETAFCGDGFALAGTEQCDDTNAVANDGCAACVIERCGDGTTQTGPVITAIDFEWLVSSCTASRTIDFEIGGPVTGFSISFPGDPESCNCAPPGGFATVTLTDSFSLAQVLDGVNDFKVDYSGAGHFLAWALVTIHTGATSTSVVVYEGAPGAALARSPSLCMGGFDEDVAQQSVASAVSVFEECDDGNQTNGDACDNDCTTGGGK